MKEEFLRIENLRMNFQRTWKKIIVNTVIIYLLSILQHKV